MSNNITISVGTEMHIAATQPATYDKAGFDALSYTEVGEVGSVPTFGGQAQVSEFTPIKTGVVNKRKGSINYGSSSVTIANVFSDAGQVMLKSAFDGAARDTVHSIKLVNSEIGAMYFTAIVTSYQYNVGDANQVTQAEVSLELVNSVVIDADVYAVTFLTGGAGSGQIIGQDVQYVVSGSDANPVYAAAESGSSFDAWSGDVTSSDNPLTVTAVTADMTVTANFTSP